MYQSIFFMMDCRGKDTGAGVVIGVKMVKIVRMVRVIKVVRVVSLMMTTLTILTILTNLHQLLFRVYPAYYRPAFPLVCIYCRDFFYIQNGWEK